MLTIRLARVGKNKKAQFKIFLQEKSVAPGGRHVEVLGSYDPHLKRAVIKEGRIKYWISKGAQISDNVISGKKRPIRLPKKVEEAKTEEVKKEEIPITETKEEVKSEKTEKTLKTE